MSSMFKKRGGLAFKPKIPSVRPRAPQPAASAAASSSQQSKPTEQPASPEPIPDESNENTWQSTESNVGHGPSTTTPQDTQPDPAIDQTSPSSPPPQPQSQPSASASPAPELPTAQNAPTKQPRTSARNKSKGAPASETATQLIDKPEVPAPSTAVENEPTQESAIDDRTTDTPLIQDDDDASIQDESGGAEKTPATGSAAVVSSTSIDITPASGRETEPTPAKPTRGRRTKAKGPPRISTDEIPGPTRSNKRKRQAAAQDATVEETPEAPPAAGGPRRRRRATTTDGQGTPRKARSVTPEDAETQTVDLQKLKMSDLTRDLHIGKKFSRHDELRDRERKARLKSKQAKEGDTAEVDGEAEAGSQDAAASQANGAEGEKAAASPAPAPASGNTSGAAAPPAGPQFRIVDGQIVVDQSSLVMDRHARAAAAQEDMELIEENDFTRLITSSSFMNTSKLKGPNLWSPEDTTLFYRGLCMFGTDFEMISKMIRGKQRRHVKLKFNREERHNPKLIDAVLKGEKTVKMDIDEYKNLTGSEFESVESIEAEHRKVEEEYEAERQRVADQQAEAMRKKREELFADEGDGTGAAPGSGAAGQRKKKKKANNKRKGSHYDESQLGVETILEE